MYAKDTFKHQGLRKQLIDIIREMGISDETILSAFYEIPRHLFLDAVFEKQAYSNVAFQIGAGQTISHPYTVAFQTQLLMLKKGMKVLEIGTGSGFQTCILNVLGAKVYSIERQQELFMKAKTIINSLNLTPKLFFGDGYKGRKQDAPYDRILVTCGAPSIPNTLLEQLSIGGIMVIPVGEQDGQVMIRITKTSENEYGTEKFGDFNFVPMLENTKK